jgi:hypothetical protein
MNDLLRKMDAYWRAANYLSVGQIYLLRGWGWPSRSNLLRNGSQGIDRITPA